MTSNQYISMLFQSIRKDKLTEKINNEQVKKKKMVKFFLCFAIQPKFSLYVWKYPRNICSWYVNAYFNRC